jgi:hypothetical protein
MYNNKSELINVMMRFPTEIGILLEECVNTPDNDKLIKSLMNHAHFLHTKGISEC